MIQPRQLDVHREAVEVLVDALEQLGARIQRDLAAELPDDPTPAQVAWCATSERLSDFAEECLSVLDDQRVLSVLGHVSSVDLQDAAPHVRSVTRL